MKHAIEALEKERKNLMAGMASLLETYTITGGKNEFILTYFEEFNAKKTEIENAINHLKKLK